MTSKTQFGVFIGIIDELLLQHFVSNEICANQNSVITPANVPKVAVICVVFMLTFTVVNFVR